MDKQPLKDNSKTAGCYPEYTETAKDKKTANRPIEGFASGQGRFRPKSPPEGSMQNDSESI